MSRDVTPSLSVVAVIAIFGTRPKRLPKLRHVQREHVGPDRSCEPVPHGTSNSGRLSLRSAEYSKALTRCDNQSTLTTLVSLLTYTDLLDLF